MKLYHDPTTASSCAVLLFAAEEAIPLDYEVVGLLAGGQQGTRFAALNPSRAVPVLEDGPFTLTDPVAILQYLAAQVGTAAYPAAAAARARVNAMLDWFNAGLRHSTPSVQGPSWPSPDVPVAMAGRAHHRLHGPLDLLESHWLGESQGPYLGGERPCLADYLGACLLAGAGLPDRALARWPRVRRWMAEMRARPGWGRVHAPITANRAGFRGHPLLRPAA